MIDGTTKSGVEDAAPESFIINATDTEAINVKLTIDFQTSFILTEHSTYICYCYSFFFL